MNHAIETFALLCNTALVAVLLTRKVWRVLPFFTWLQCAVYLQDIPLYWMRFHAPGLYAPLWYASYVIQVAEVGLFAVACHGEGVFKVCRWMMACELPLRFMAWDQFRSPYEFHPTLPYYLYFALDMAWTIILWREFHTSPGKEKHAKAKTTASRRARYRLPASTGSNVAASWWNAAASTVTKTL